MGEELCQSETHGPCVRLVYLTWTGKLFLPTGGGQSAFAVG
jgi:hypothetical protein